MKIFKGRLLSALAICAISVPAFCFNSNENNVSAQYLSYARVHYITGTTSLTKSGTITFDDDFMSYVYYESNWLGARTVMSKTTQSGKHDAGIYSSQSGKSKWTGETTACNIETGRVSRGNCTVMGMIPA